MHTNGVLFLDELAEFKGGLLDLLRAPLEEHCIRLSRAGRNVTYPANFLLFGAMNPCSCGYYPDMQRCRCSEPTLRRYFDKVSQPIIDRIDICVEASPLSFEDINSTTSNESSAGHKKACYALPRASKRKGLKVRAFLIIQKYQLTSWKNTVPSAVERKDTWKICLTSLV